MKARWAGLGLVAITVVACAQQELLPCQPGAERKPGSDKCVPKNTGGDGGGVSTGSVLPSTSSGSTDTTTSSSTGSSTSSSSGSGGSAGCDPGNVVPGSFPIGPSDAVVPLCNAQVILGDKGKKTVEIRDIATKATVKSWQLSAPPGDIVYDEAHNTAYVTEDGANSLAVIDLSATTVSEIALTAPAVRLALGDDGQVFASLQASTFDVPIVLIAGGTATNLTIPSQEGTLLAYDRATHRLFIGVDGISPSGLARYAYDATAKTLTLQQERQDAGGNGQDIALSPDGKHLAFPCGGGNGPNYTVFDFDPDDLNTKAGEWDTGPYPRSAAFSPEGTRVLATNGNDMFVFDIATYMQIDQDKPTLCSYGELDRVAISPGGRIFYAITKCGFDSDTGYLHWYVH